MFRLSIHVLFRRLPRPTPLSPRSINRTIRTLKSLKRLKFARTSAKLAILSKLCTTVIMDQNDLDVQRALEEGDVALVKLMEEIKDNVVETSGLYRDCLRKQIEITRTASQVGPLAEAWDELTKYRSDGGDLLKEINENVAIFNTIGEMAREESLVVIVTGATEQSDVVERKYEELKRIVTREVEENKQLEMELLKISCDSILHQLNDDLKT